MKPKAKYTKAAAQPMQVNVEGVLMILASAIYAMGKEVAFREFLQNAHDALTALALLKSGFRGKVSVEVVCNADGSMTVVFGDNGIGLTAEEVQSVLSTVALGMKCQEGLATGESPFVGRFGIGILSGFLVSPEITVISRHALKLDEPAVRWTGRKDGLCQTEILEDTQIEPGTRVFLRLDPETARAFPPEVIFELLQKYGRYLPHPIEFQCQGQSRMVNEVPVWDRNLDQAEMVKEGEEIFGEAFVGAFPFSHQDSGSKGIAFIKAEPMHPTSVSLHTVFIKRMLITDEAAKLHPAGAPFLTLLMNSTHLQPNAGRDSLMETDPLIPALRDHLSQALLEYLIGLRGTEPERLKLLVLRQHRCLTHLAESDVGFVPLLIEALEVETTLGRMPMAKILQRHAHEVRYTQEDEDYLRLEGRARIEGDCIVRTRTDVEHRLIRAVRGTLGDRLRPITSREYLSNLTRVGDSLSRRELHIQEAIGEILRQENCSGGFYDGDDPDELGRLDMDEDESLTRLLRSRMDGENAAMKTLQLNRENPLVSQLVNGGTDSDGLRNWVRILYQVTLLQAREHPTRRENRHFSGALLNAFTAGTLNPIN
jgi:molecular chaperone HtpG